MLLQWWNAFKHLWIGQLSINCQTILAHICGWVSLLLGLSDAHPSLPSLVYQGCTGWWNSHATCDRPPADISSQSANQDGSFHDTVGYVVQREKKLSTGKTFLKHVFFQESLEMRMPNLISIPNLWFVEQALTNPSLTRTLAVPWHRRSAIATRSFPTMIIIMNNSTKEV